jgi:hypothetical protein
MTNTKMGLTRLSDSVRGWRSESSLVLVIVVLGVGVLYATFLYGQKRLAIAEDRLRQTLADEDRAFCEKFGMRAGTSQFVACGQELGIIRQAQADRERAAVEDLP